VTTIGVPVGERTDRVGLPTWAVPAGIVSALVALQLALGSDRVFPTNWNINLADPIDDAQRWVRENRRGDHWLFTTFLNPVSDGCESALDRVADILTWLPWFVLPALVFIAIARTGRWISATITALVALYPAAVGLWEETVDTLALMFVAVAVSIAVGTALGVWAGLDARVERALRPLLDAMQVVPTTVYLIPYVLLFGIGPVPATIATVIYAIPPCVRLTALGIRQVPLATVESARIFGSTRLQTLTKVQLPQATPSIITGVNQTINMALGIVPIAALIGGGGLGQEVLETIRIRRPGRGFIAGFAFVAIAIVFDRVARSFIERADPSTRAGVPRRARTITFVALGALAIATLAGRAAGWIDIPVEWSSTFADPIDDVIRWIRDEWGAATRAVNDFVVRELVVRGRDTLTNTLAWPVLIGATAALGYWAKGWRLALGCTAGMLATGMVGMWVFAIDTFVQTVIAVVAAVAIAVPVGIWAGRRPLVERLLGPVLDALQTIPSLIYAIPFVMIFTVSPVPGILASVLYAVPPGIRLTALGLRHVDDEAVEAATTFGATPRQVLWGVRVPLALPSIVLAVNQVIMMVLAMVIIAGLVGSGALGFQAVTALTSSSKAGLGFEVGIAIVAMAIMLDRLMHGVAQRLSPPTAH